MSWEIKSVDVENEEEEKVITVFQSFGWKLKSSQRVFNQSSTPRGAISYENLTCIHSETETIDFTKLVFERDTKMPNYDEIVELEEEFWELSSECPTARPIEPELMDFEKWVDKANPSAFSKSSKIRTSFLFYIISGIVFGLFVYFVGTVGEEFDASVLSLIACVALSLIIVPMHLYISKALFYVYNRYHLKTDNLKDNEFLQKQYSEYVNDTKASQAAAISFDNSIRTMRELIQRSEKLL